jgi:hypothetical protein
MATPLTITLARTQPAAYREQFNRASWPEQYVYVRSLDLDGLRAHGEAMGAGAPWSLGLLLDEALRPASVECSIGYNDRKHVVSRPDALAVWLAEQCEQARRGGCRLVGCALSLPNLTLDSDLEGLLQRTLPGIGWQPTWLWLNTVGYSDRGEPPDPSTSLRIHGTVRWPQLGPRGTDFQSTVASLLPTNVSGWTAHITAVARQLGLGLQVV